jgi:hypothetical protein
VHSCIKLGCRPFSSVYINRVKPGKGFSVCHAVTACTQKLLIIELGGMETGLKIMFVQ